MLSTRQMADILSKARMSPPSPPVQADAASQQAWAREVEQQFVDYSAARAARGLREAEDARQREMLRRMAWSSAPH